MTQGGNKGLTVKETARWILTKLYEEREEITNENLIMSARRTNEINSDSLSQMKNK